MNNIKSLYNGKITSEHQTAEITSKTPSDFVSKTELNVYSDIEESTEREAFLATAKRNAALMFSKYL